MTVEPSLWWITAPILTGPALHFSPVSELGLRAAALLGVAIVRPADVTVSGNYAEAEYTHEIASAFCGGFEAGLDISQILVMCRFIFSWLDDVDGEEDITIAGFEVSGVYEKDFPVAILQLSLGYRF